MLQHAQLASAAAPTPTRNSPHPAPPHPISAIARHLDDNDNHQTNTNTTTIIHPIPTHRQVDVIYALSQAWCKSRDDADFAELERYLTELRPEERILVGVILDCVCDLG